MNDKQTAIKICGITQRKEALVLNEAGANYAGFVFFPRSKRNISIPEAQEIMKALDPSIQKVAVTVSPLVDVIQELNRSGFDILQIHGTLSRRQLEAAELPVWYAFNIADPAQLLTQEAFLSELPEELQKKITGIVVDAADFGSGQTFNWQEPKWRQSKALQNRFLILAGGLTPENVAEGISLFAPDVVDVSSGVEIAKEIRGKDPEKIKEFCRQVELAGQSKEEI